MSHLDDLEPRAKALLEAVVDREPDGPDHDITGPAAQDAGLQPAEARSRGRGAHR